MLKAKTNTQNEGFKTSVIKIRIKIVGTLETTLITKVNTLSNIRK